MIQWLRSLYPRQISSFVLVFVGPCPVLCCFAVLLVAKRKSGWGICGSFLVAFFLFVWFVFRDDLPEFLDHTCPILYCFSPLTQL